MILGLDWSICCVLTQMVTLRVKITQNAMNIDYVVADISAI